MPNTQFDNSIESYQLYDLQTDSFVKTVFSGSGGLQTLKEIAKVIFHIKPITSHMMRM